MQVCVTCGKNAPETETNYTLISAQFGWRLTRRKREDGDVVLEWRCPSCWRDFKRARPAVPGGRPSRSSMPAPLESTSHPVSRAASDGSIPLAPPAPRMSPKTPSAAPPSFPRRPPGRSTR